MYIFTYYLNNQSRLFSEPQKVLVRAEMLELALHTALENGYEIVSIVKNVEDINDNSADV